MKTMLLTMIALLLVGAVPTTTAGTCANPIPQEETLEISEGSYLYVPTSPDSIAKVGIWEETNRKDGLQTSSCVVSGILQYKADTQRDLLP